MTGFVEGDGLRMSAALAFYASFSLAPLLMVATAMAGFFFGEDAVKGALDSQLQYNLGTSGARVVQDLLAHTRAPGNNAAASLTGLGLALVGAAGVFGQLKDALNSTWKIETPRGQAFHRFSHDHLLSFSMVLVTGLLLLMSMILSALLEAAGNYVGSAVGLTTQVCKGLNGGVSFVVITLLFSAIFRILPDCPIRWREVWVGGLFSAVLFMAGKSVVGWYLARQATTSAYGTSASFAVILTWLYYSSAIVLLGARFTQVYSEHLNLKEKMQAAEDTEAHETSETV
ncbi:MAG: YihY/virulence factor BrkB family protein [Luteolibacter sp.]